CIGTVTSLPSPGSHHSGSAAPDNRWRPTTRAWHPAGMHPGIHAQNHPDKPAVIAPSHNVTVTYRELDESSNRAAHLFRSLGLIPGDGIAILLENHPRFYEVVWGAQRSGLYYTPMSTRLPPGRAGDIADA